MGANSIRSYSIIFAIAGVALLYFSPEIYQQFVSLFPLIGISEQTAKTFLEKFNLKHPVEESSETTVVGEGEGSIPLFTQQELSKYDGGPNSLGLYLAILGEIYDVAKGAQHYKPGSSYSFFAGRDASRAYVTGDFTDKEKADDLSDLDDASVASIVDWLSFYKDEYIFKGRLIGRYYDKDGKPTKDLDNVKSKMKAAESNKWLEDNEKKVFPPCNSEWSKEIGSRVWCTKKSGGVDRNWVGVPRKLYKAGKDARCVCVRATGPPSNAPDSKKHNNVGDLENPSLHEYQNCPPKSDSCQVDHP